MLRITPKATPRKAANSTWSVPGSRKVMVCIGYQNSGIVLAKVDDLKKAWRDAYKNAAGLSE